MKSIFAILIALLFLLQYELWFSNGGLSTIHQLKQNIALQQSENKHLKERNALLLADIKDLKKGNAAVEEHARNDLGMIKQGEIFYQVVDKQDYRKSEGQ